MKNKLKYLLPMALMLPVISYAQLRTSMRGLLQQRFLIETMITPQLKGKPLPISKNSDIDGLFNLMETSWKKTAPDSLKKYPSELTLAEFNNIDAYCYFWALTSMTQNLNAGTDYGDYLVKNYMAPAMHRDYETLLRAPTAGKISLIHSGNLGNTLAIGSSAHSGRETFLATFGIYTGYKNLFTALAQNPDTTISTPAREQLRSLDNYYYPMNARNSFELGEMDQAFNFVITGLNTDKYSKSRAIDLIGKLIAYYSRAGEKDKCFALLNTLAINTTSDNLNRDTLMAYYLKVDPVAGGKMYANLKQKLSMSSFKPSGQTVKLPVNWSFLTNAIPAEKLNKVKYILVDCWYTSCGPCLEEIPELNAFYDGLKQRQDVAFISINTDYINGKTDKNYVQKRSGELKIRYPVFYDNIPSELNKQLSVSGYPAKFILSSRGDVFVKTDQSAMTLASFEAFLKEQP